MLTRQKAQLRERLKQKRQELAQDRRQEFNQAIHQRLLQQLAAAGTVFCYVSAGLEVDTRGVIERLRQLDKTVVVPRVLNRERMIAVRFDGWETLRVGALGILTPDSAEEWQAGVDLCITPGLGFTRDGRRIGYGRGYYDKWLTAHPRSATTALCYECQLVDDIPTSATDVRVQRIITERQVINCHQYSKLAQQPGTS